MSKSYTLAQIAHAAHGRLIGDGSLTVTRLCHPADLVEPHDLALAMDPKLLPLLKDSAAKTAVITDAGEADTAFLAGRIVVARPRLALAQLTALFAQTVAVKGGIHPSAVIEEGAEIGPNPRIGAFVYIGADAKIGANAVLHPHSYIGEQVVMGDDAVIYAGVKIGAGTRIGHRVMIHFNTSIGADGFSFVTPQTGSVEAAKAGHSGTVTAANTALIRIASLAPVVIGDDVEIGANTSIDRGTIAPTRIGNGTKIDNQVQIGHNVQIGDHCMICGRVGIAGSVQIGDRVVLGGAVGVADHVSIGDDAIAMALSGIAGNVPARTVVGGIPAVSREKLMENYFLQGRLKQLYKKTDALAAKLVALEKSPENG